MILERARLREIEAAASRAHPGECCGFLLGRGAAGALRVTGIRPATNVEADRVPDAFRVDPEEVLAAGLEAARLGLEVVGVYHSHPDAPAIPSQRDLAAALPGWHYLILATAAGRPVEARCWRLRSGTGEFEEDRLEITDASPGS